MLAGLVDSGLASLATFAIGVYAVRALDPTVLGGYALVYQAIFLVGMIPANLVFTPAEVIAVEHPEPVRPVHLARSLPYGALFAIPAGLAVAIWIPIAPPEIPAGAITALTITGIATAIVSPIQDHVRRVLHSGGYSRDAAVVSGVQLGVAGVSIAVLHLGGLPVVWIPFGALAIANVTSFSIAVVLARLRTRGKSVERELEFGELVAAGRWLAGGAALNPATGFVSAALVSRLASAAALGYAEAARVVAQPVWVLAVGLSAVLGPRSMEAARRGERVEARKVSRVFLTVVLVTGACVLAWLGPDWPLNPMAWLMPAAFAVEGLVAASIVAQILAATIFPYRSELIGARREATYTRIELWGSIVRTAVSATARFTRAFAIPLGIVAIWVFRWFAYRRVLRGVYASEGGGPGEGKAVGA